MSTHFQFDKRWSLQPIEGDTGQTFMGVKDSEKVFIKRNSSPFLAVLSREGIAPKLMWTKRTGDGDILIAQEWLDGQLLTPVEVGKRLDVVETLQHLHTSDSLKKMLYRVGGKEQQAFDFLSEYARQLPQDLKHNTYLLQVFRYLEDHIPSTNELRACHGDPVHTNWLLSTEGRLYLVDWDSTKLADPASDLGIVLGRYVPFSEWENWLKLYGIELTDDLLNKIYWYSGIDYLLRIKKHFLYRDYQQMNRELIMLKEIYTNFDGN
ncbi:phosphotransferase family protein [Vagococcus humatus]|uniref:Aminoglycoside phosphotransferase n=1 Tax=Vagococcus humatus TaxID=1889241 RepID=A0A3S0AZ15_9ENTE|nr:phosphotransferase family protein [Vagococcus humatus]RST90339.1 aminoglycoside phosphotransferase [Vagococcus humatus]